MPHLETKYQGRIAPNITIVKKQRWDAAEQKRWDETDGGAIDGMLKDDGGCIYVRICIDICVYIYIYIYIYM